MLSGFTDSPHFDQYKYMIPFRSDYYESFGKLSIEGELGSVKNTFTIKGGAFCLLLQTINIIIITVAAPKSAWKVR